MKNKQTYFVGLLLLFIYACNSNTTPNHAEERATIKGGKYNDDTLDFILQPVSQQVLASIPVIKMHSQTIAPQFNYQGFTSFIPQNSTVMSAKITGRVEDILVKYNYQKVVKGQKLFTIYSPELLTEQNNLLYLLKQDSGNTVLIEATKNKLRLLGLSDDEFNQIIKSHKPLMAVGVYSNYTGFITDAGNSGLSNAAMGEGSSTTILSLKKGSYLQKGQAAFKIIDNRQLWLMLSIPASDLAVVKVGDKVVYKPETSIGKAYSAEINYIEPLLDEAKKTVNARAIINNTNMQLPVPTQVNATVTASSFTSNWIPASAVIDLGKNKAVFVKSKLGFKIKTVTTALHYHSLIQIVAGISNTDEIALNAQYLMDSESFIKQLR